MPKDIRMLPLDALVEEFAPFRKPMSERFSKALDGSFDEFGFAGVLIVAPLPDGTFVIADGNTRKQKLLDHGYTAVECEVRPDLADRERRLLFQATYNRTGKPYDEGELTRTMETLQQAYPLDKLATLTARLDLVQHRVLPGVADPSPGPSGSSHVSAGHAPASPSARRSGPLDLGILTLAGPSALIDEIKLMLPKRLDHLQSLRRIKDALLEPFPLEDEDLVTLVLHSALLIRQWRGGEP